MPSATYIHHKVNELQPLKSSTTQKVLPCTPYTLVLETQKQETAFPLWMCYVSCSLWTLIIVALADFLFCSLILFIIICRFIYETEHHNGIAELLEILGR